MTASELRVEGPVLLRDDLDGIRTLTLNRPRRKNAIDTELWGGCLRDALDDAGTDPDVRAVVLTGDRSWH